MKKNFKYALLGAIALTGAVCFSACSSSDEIVDNPNYNPEDNSVKTAFTLSVGDLKSAATRMSAAEVQADQTTFNGMTDIYLFPAKAAITAATVTSESYIHLEDFTGFNQSVEKAKGKIYNDVDLSVGVSNFLFYAAEKNNVTNGKLKASYLKMAASTFNGTKDWAPEPITTASEVGDIHFDLVPIQKEGNLEVVKTFGATTIAPLNAVDKALTAQITAATTSDEAIANELKDIQKVLRNDKSSTSDPDYKPYAGSSLSMKSLMTMLYNALQTKSATLGTYGAAIISIIEASFNASGDLASGYTLTWKSDPAFPSGTSSLGLPDGAVAVKYIGTDVDAPFDYVQPSVDGMEISPISKYTYPARLYYTVNTPAMVKDAEYLSTNDNDENDTWEKVKVAGAYVQTAITSSTRSVIMKDMVQYAVGRLDVSVRVKPSATIVDNNPGVSPSPVTVPAGGYKLTGVLIGDQRQVGWDFTPVTSATAQTIWDNKMNVDIFAKQQDGFSGVNHTLALETAANTPINIALEFENTGNDFYGVENNIIPAGTKFYLVAKLTPGTNVYYNENGLNQVFKQDYVTTVNLTIGEQSLKKAYNVVPDLRAPKLEFGLSVDLNWRPGITFEQEFLAN